MHTAWIITCELTLLNILKIETYSIIRSYRYRKDLHVYKAYKTNDPNVHYVIKKHKTEEVFKRESQILKKLSGTKVFSEMYYCDFFFNSYYLLILKIFIKTPTVGQTRKDVTRLRFMWVTFHMLFVSRM